MIHDDDFTVVYVITSGGNDTFADMAVVSMLSVRITNPGIRIAALCDAASAEALHAKGHRILEIVDDAVSVDTPPGEPVFRNRWIKTQLPHFIRGSALYLDADTLTRKSLRDLPRRVAQFGAVANHHGVDTAAQIWEEDLNELKGMAWPKVFPVYINGGVFFWHTSPETFSFFDMWHDMWHFSARSNGRLRDQPALNAALLRSGIAVDELPAEYNWQVYYKPLAAPEARILHLYPNPMTLRGGFRELVQAARHTPIKTLEKHVRSCIRRPAASPYENSLTRLKRWVKRRIVR